MPLTLLVPDLLVAADAPDALRTLRLPRLETWLARADGQRVPAGRSGWLFGQWGLGAQAPVAALTLAADGGPREGTWMRADPVHQRVERHALVLHDGGTLALSADEVREAVAALNAFFARDGLEFAAPTRERWYVRLPEGEAPRTVPFEEAVGRNPFGMIPQGGVRLSWPSIFSEAQMLLAALPLNAAREADGRPALNGLWFWGAGTFPARLACPYRAIAAADPLARGLALASGADLRALPGDPSELASWGGGPGLVVLDALGAPLRQGDFSGWRAAAERLDRQWFRCLGDLLAAHRHLRLVLPGDRETAVFDLAPGARWRLLRRARPLASHA